MPSAAIHEIVSLRHPARFYCRPDQPAFAMVAIKDIKTREAIGNNMHKHYQHAHWLYCSVSLIKFSIDCVSMLPT